MATLLLSPLTKAVTSSPQLTASFVISCPAFPFAQWKVLIIRDLLTGTKRFSELKKSVQGISQKVLTSHLRDMESDGLVDRKIYAQVPPRVEYSLTESRLTLKPVLDAMEKWGKMYRNAIAGKEHTPQSET